MNGLAYQNRITLSRGDGWLWLIRSTAMIVSSVVLGGLLTRLLSADSLLELAYTASSHFAIPFSNCVGWLERLQLLLKFAAVDMACIWITVCSVLLTAKYLIVDLVLVFSGIRFGLLSVLLYHMAFEEVINGFLSWGEWISFVLCKGLVLISILLFAYRSLVWRDESFFSHWFYKISLNRQMLLRLICRAVGVSVCVLLLNGIYCMLIYVL